MSREDFAWANNLRRQYFPPERNQVPAHITLFHHLPGHCENEILADMQKIGREFRPPRARLASVMKLGNGAAFLIESEELQAIRTIVADDFFGLLTKQDQGRSRLHITVQNKVTAAVAKETYTALSTQFVPRSLTITGLQIFRYNGGRWDDIKSYKFRGRHGVFD